MIVRTHCILPSALVLAMASIAVGCAPSATVRPTVTPQPVAVLNFNSRSYIGRLVVGLDPAGESTIRAGSCTMLSPPAGREGELRVQVLDPESSEPVLDLYGASLARTWTRCTCNGAPFDHCVTVPQRAR